MNFIIGLVGRAGAGKDTVADHLVAKYGFVRIAFADKLKQIVSDLYCVPIEHFHDRELKNVPNKRLSGRNLLASMPRDALAPILAGVFVDLFGSTEHAEHSKRIFLDLLPDTCSPRLACQLIGTEGFRAISDSVWTDYAMGQAQQLKAQGRDVVIPDVRFPNEMDAIRFSVGGGLMVGIFRGNSERYDHDSEAHVDSMIQCCNHAFNNDGTIEDLQIKANQLVGRS